MDRKKGVKPMNDVTTKAKAGQYLTFQLMAEQYGVPIETVREINRVGEITPVPRTPECVKGVMNLRGKIIPVVNLRVKFGMEPQAYTRDTCIIVIDTQIGQVGMIVDSVKEVVDLKDNQIEPSPVLGNEASMTFVRGMGKVDQRVIILVDIVSSFSHEQLAGMSSMAPTANAA
jgi:purine-binding chemotaxis protein CheW